MSESEKKDILGLDLDDAQLENAAGGNDRDRCGADQASNCVIEVYRAPGSCAATVEDGSRCWDNDACTSSAVIYRDYGEKINKLLTDAYNGKYPTHGGKGEF